MSASSSLSRLEFVLNSAEAAERAHSNTSGSGAGSNGASGGLVAMMPTWLGGGGAGSASPSRSNGGLPHPVGGSSASSASSSAAASASALASSAAASASLAASRVTSKTQAWFGQLSSKVTGREYVPAAEPAQPSAGDIEEGSTLLPSADPGGPSSSLAASFSSELSALTTLSWRHRLMGFGFSLAAGCCMMGLAFMYLPLVFLGAPAKFALSYAMANGFLVGSSLFLVGPSKQIKEMFSPARAFVSAVYLGSLVLLFYVSWQWRSFLIVVPVLVVQVASLAAYVASYVPFGQAMLTRIWGWTVGRQLSALTGS